MNASSEDDLDVVCAHEAGHAVVGFKFNQSFDVIVVQRERGPHAADWLPWDGHVKNWCKETTAQADRDIALAGPLSEAKTLCSRLGHDLSFETDTWEEQFLDEVLSWHEQYSADPDKSYPPIDVTVRFRLGQSSHATVIPIHQGDLAYMGGTRMDLYNNLSRVRSQLDEQRIWTAINEVKLRLMRETPFESMRNRTQVQSVRLAFSEFQEIMLHDNRDADPK